MNIVVLGGGLSPERNVSLSSGTLACNEFLRAGHQAVLLDLFFGMPEYDGDAKKLFASASPLSPRAVGDVAPDLKAVAAERKEGYSDTVGLNVIEICREADIVYMALHGADGENGSVQKLFDSFGIRYTGSGSEGCRLAMEKNLSKEIFLKNGVVTPEGVLLKKGEPFDCSMFSLPAVAKPNSGGSSIGISIAHTREELEAAIETAFREEDSILVEEYIEGRGLSCGVLGGKALPVIEIIPKEGFYDYVNKYKPGATLEITPARISETDTKTVQAAAEKVFSLLGLSVYARIDFLLTKAGKAYCLEANTLPGMTPTSLLPQEAAAAGISYLELCETVIRLSLEKYHD